MARTRLNPLVAPTYERPISLQNRLWPERPTEAGLHFLENLHLEDVTERATPEPTAIEGSVASKPLS